MLGGDSDYHERNQVAIDLKNRLRELSAEADEKMLPGQEILKMLKYDNTEEGSSGIAKSEGQSGKKLSMKDYLAAKRKAKATSADD